MFECRPRKNTYPKEGEIVIGKVIKTDGDMVSVVLLEYDNCTGLVFHSELSKKIFKTIAQVTKVGMVEILTVLLVEEGKGFIDLSLKRPTEEEKGICREKFARTKAAYQIMLKVAKAEEVSVSELYSTFGYQREEEFGELYNYFIKIKDNLDALDNVPYGASLKQILAETFKVKSYKARIDVEVTCPYGGVQGLKKIFAVALDQDPNLEITLLKSPVYSIVRVSDKKEDAFGAINKACESLKETIHSMDGTYSVVVPTKLYGEKAKHSRYEPEIKEASEESSG